MNAQQTYGYVANLPGGGQTLPNANGVDGSAGVASGVSLNNSGLSGHLNNPFFWALVLTLFLVGYLGFAFDVNVKRIGDVAVHGGNRA